MNKIILLLAGIFSIFSANAQYMGSAAGIQTNNTKQLPFIKGHGINRPAHHLAAKTTSVTTIATETFGTGTTTSLPTGWTAGAYAGGTWHWTNMADTSSAYSLGTMNSTTAGNGWMIFDSDSMGTACSCAPAGWLQSPAYYCDTDSVVVLNFEDYYEKFNDSCFVWVSTSPTFATYTSYPVQMNNTLLNNMATANPATVTINISSVAAAQPAVYIRFVYYDNAGNTGGYSWMIDDISLFETGPDDVGISGSFIYEPETTAYDGSIFNTPLVFVDSLYPVTQLSNYGTNAQTSITVTASITGGATPYNKTDSFLSISLNGYDSLIQFPGFMPSDTGSYTCTFRAAIANDANAANNTDNVSFNVTDTLWEENMGAVPTTSYYLYSSSGGSPVSYMQGTRFDVPSSSAGDTISGFGVAFSPESLPTTGSATVSVQLYSAQKSSSHWDYVATSVARPVTMGDLSTPTLLVWADFRIDPASSGGITPFILHAGTSYAAVVQVNGVTTELDVYATPAFSGTIYNPRYFDQSDTSNDDGATSFGHSSVATGYPGPVPMVRMYFGNDPEAYTAVKNVTATGNYVGAAIPNPANTSVTIPFNMAQDAMVTITLFNVVGQEMNTQNIQATGGKSMKATIGTNDLADGVYLYSVAANGQVTNGRVVVTH